MSESYAQRPDADVERAQAFGEQLVEVHGWLRAELSSIRREVDEFVAGRADAPAATRTPPSLTVQLRTRCLEFCADLHHHHTGEDGILFPALAEDVPELVPVLPKLQQQHMAVGRILDALQATLQDAADTDPAWVRAELARLSAELEAHLSDEEAQIVDAMNAMRQERVDALTAAAEAQAAQE
ncbi:hemerythrin domain-containing protein [Phytoactinopolyspora halotolerans]|uniref:Hemerythrin domain-containing protein n=1 Tax=Phytoactinopolyspora halotolerans TaxID=1981512 RepID=A0A6L9SBH2_9ACTN|nr:hemerythrin domain-containing protein [Phytoactinopolyspora halotolerans]NEE01360.1 hemerythrin domain-containing protein [Phytoactinopolyspora halotolerans]